MEKVKHTPGPWRIDDNEHDIEILADPGFPCRYFGEEGVWPIAKAMNLHHADDSAGGVMEANARLIAAAPEMLEALQCMIDAYSEPDQQLCCDGQDCGCMGSTVRQLAEHCARAAIAKAIGQ